MKFAVNKTPSVSTLQVLGKPTHDPSPWVALGGWGVDGHWLWYVFNGLYGAFAERAVSVYLGGCTHSREDSFAGIVAGTDPHYNMEFSLDSSGQIYTHAIRSFFYPTWNIGYAYLGKPLPVVGGQVQRLADFDSMEITGQVFRAGVPADWEMRMLTLVDWEASPMLTCLSIGSRPLGASATFTVDSAWEVVTPTFDKAAIIASILANCEAGDYNIRVAGILRNLTEPECPVGADYPSAGIYLIDFVNPVWEEWVP